MQRKEVMAKRSEGARLDGARSVSTRGVASSGSTFSRGLVILVGFANKAFTETNANFTNLLNQQGYSYNGATGSAKDHYRDCSYGEFDPVFDVYGPYTLDRNMGYYGSNGYSGSDQHPDQMVVDAVAKLCAAEGDTILKRYDCDNDGYVDNVFVYYAGYAESSGAPDSTIWPHRYWVMQGYVSGKRTYAGKTIYDYACSSEYDGTSGAKRTGIGAFTHEFSHVLGLPDLYDTEYSYTHYTPGEWDIMDAGCYNNNENTPPAYSSEARFYVGWLTPTVLNQAGTYTLECLSDTAQAYLISATGSHNLKGDNPNPKNYYLFENRQQRGWDAYLPGHGMLVWKIQYSSSKWEGNTVNNSKNSLGCNIVSAKNPTSTAYRSSYGEAYDPFPGTKKVTSYTPITGYDLTNIAESSGVISFTLGAPAGVEDASVMGEIIMFSTDGEYYTVDNIPENATLRCFDAMGRMLWSAENVESTYTFSNGREVFFLQIQAGGKTTTLKGI